MFCERCGKEISDSAAFCKHCGSPVNSEGIVAGNFNATKKDEFPKSKEKKKFPFWILIIVAVVLFILLIGIGSGLGLFVLTSPWAKEKRFYSEAQKYESQGDYDDAINAYESLIDINDSNADYYYALAKAYYNKVDVSIEGGNKTEAQDFLNKAESYLDKALKIEKAAEFTKFKEKITEKKEEINLLSGLSNNGENVDTDSNDNTQVSQGINGENIDSFEEKDDAQILESIRVAINTAILDPQVVSDGGGYYSGKGLIIDKVLFGSAVDSFFEIMGVNSYDEVRNLLKSDEARKVGQIYVDINQSGTRVYCGDLSAGQYIGNQYNSSNSGTYGDWAVTQSPYGFWWGGTWVVSSQAAVDAGKAEGIKEIIEYITLDDSESGLQYAWATDSFLVPDSIDLENIKPANGGSKGTIELWNFTNEIPKMVYLFIKNHPDFEYNVHITIKGTGDGYQDALDNALINKKVDIYGVESAFVLRYTQGEMSKYAASYSSLGIDYVAACKAADIAQYTIDIGTRPSDGELVGLGYQSTSGVFIYRRSIAKDVWGTDNPDVIKEKIGGGTNSWDAYWVAAEELKRKGYVICSGDDDIWYPVFCSAEKGWIVDGKLYIDPKREEYLDFAKKIYENGYSNNTSTWYDEWFYGMKGYGDKEVFGYFGPAWFVKYTLLYNCGNSPSYYQSFGDSVAASTIMNEIPSTTDFLDGQDMFEEFAIANQRVNGKNTSIYDERIQFIWHNWVCEYAYGNLSREEAIQSFKSDVYYQLGIKSY